jgi:hypothetical protein
MRRHVPVLATVLLASACGYTFGSGLPGLGVRSVALQVAGNSTWRQRLEVDLSVALARELPISTDLVVTDRRRADAVLEVEFVDARERPLLVAGGRPAGDPTPTRTAEGSLEGTVRIRLVRRDGSVALSRVVVDRTEFRDFLGESLLTARSELVDDLARKVALALESEP